MPRVRVDGQHERLRAQVNRCRRCCPWPNRAPSPCGFAAVRHVEPAAGRVERQTVRLRDAVYSWPDDGVVQPERSCSRRAARGRRRPCPDRRRTATAHGSRRGSATVPACSGRRPSRVAAEIGDVKIAALRRSRRPACRRRESPMDARRCDQHQLVGLPVGDGDQGVRPGAATTATPLGPVGSWPARWSCRRRSGFGAHDAQEPAAVVHPVEGHVGRVAAADSGRCRADGCRPAASASPARTASASARAPRWGWRRELVWVWASRPVSGVGVGVGVGGTG